MTKNKWRITGLHVHERSHKVDRRMEYSFYGKITYENKLGDEFTLRLNDEQCRKISAVISEGLVSKAQELSEEITKAFSLNVQSESEAPNGDS